MKKSLMWLVIAGLFLFFCFRGHAGNGSHGKKTALTASLNTSGTAKSSDAGKLLASQAVFKIQILALCCPLPQQASFFKRYGGKANESVFRNQYIYTVGNFNNEEKARETLAYVRKSYPHAFIVEFRNGTRNK